MFIIDINILLMIRKISLSFLLLLILAFTNIGQSIQASLKPQKVSKQQVIFAQQECNITHFEYIGNFTLGQNDQLNRTLEKIGDKIKTLDNVTWKTNDTATYRIYEANPTFYYRDSKQKAEIVGNDTIVIDGGYAQVSIQFKWSRTGSNPANGTAVALGLSDQIIFAKEVIIENDFFRYELADYLNVTFDTPMNLSRVSPPQTSQQDKKNILKLVNNIPNITTLRFELEADIALYYPLYLRANLHDQSMPIDQHFQYHWVSPISTKPNLNIQFTRRPSFIDVEKDGIYYGYQAKVDNYSNNKCGPMPPVLPLNPKVYGHSQEFISFIFYQNVIRYALQKGQFDTVLNPDNWESRMFQFYAGDLYEVFPRLMDQFMARTPVTGNCKAIPDHLKVFKSHTHTFNVSIYYDCQLNVNRSKILDFSVGTELEVQGVPNATHLQFKLRSHLQYVTYYEYAGYKMANKQLANKMVEHSLNRLYETPLFGSGWPLHPKRDYPHFETQHDATVVYDSTHVDP